MCIVPLSLTRDYVSDWTVEDAVREFIQNAIDTGKYEIFFIGTTIFIKSFGGKLSRKSLLLGGGNKQADSSAIGGYGEGYKIGSLVLVREQHNIYIYNGTDELWRPCLINNQDYDAECLHFHIETGRRNGDNADDCVEVCIADLTEGQVRRIKENTLCLQDSFKSHCTDIGDVLLGEQHRGKVFVGGLFVGHFESNYGFNFKPDNFPLNRDRKSVNPFEVKWKMRDVWQLLEKRAEEDPEIASTLFDCIIKADNSAELTTLNGSNSTLNSKVENWYSTQHPGTLVTDDIEDLNTLKDAGNKAVYLKDSSLVRIIKQSDTYQTVLAGANKPDSRSVQELFEDYRHKWYDDISHEAYVSLDELENKVIKAKRYERL